MILDTDGVAAIAGGDPKLEPVLVRATRLAVPVIVLGEYRYGISHSRNCTHYKTWLAKAVKELSVLPVDEETAVTYAQIGSELRRSGRPIASNDVWIAALAG